MFKTLWTLCFAASLFSQEPRKRPVPEASAVRDAEKLVRDVFKDDYAKKSAADRLLLARKLLDQAGASSDDPSKYALLREAADLAAACGDAGLAFEAVDALARVFEVEVVQLKSSILALLAGNVKSADEILALAQAHLKLASDAADVEEFDAALKAVDGAVGLAKKGKDTALAARLAARRREINDLKEGSRAVQKARESLLKNPDDPAANLAVGQYECLKRGDWTRGLPFLSKGSGPLGALAAKDYASPKDPPERMFIGDAYLELSDKESGALREGLRSRAAHWYEAALPGLTGLNKARVEKRLPGLLLERFKGVWVDVADPKAFGLSGAAGDPIVLTPPGGKVATLSRMPEGEFDGVSLRMKVADGARSIGSLHYERNKRGLLLDFHKGRAQRARMVNGAWSPEWEGEVGTRESFVLTILLEFGEYVMYVDSREVARERTPFGRLISLSLQADHGSVSVDHFKLRKKD